MWQLRGLWMFSVGEGNMFWSSKKVDSGVKSGSLLVFAFCFCTVFWRQSFPKLTTLSNYFYNIRVKILNHEMVFQANVKNITVTSFDFNACFLVKTFLEPFIVVWIIIVVPSNARKICIQLPHSQTIKEVFEEANAKSRVIHHGFYVSAPGVGHPQGMEAIDSVVRSLMGESAGRCAPEVSLPPAHWTVHKWCNCCIA